MLDLFRFNSLLSASGDRLVAPVGLTSARWQIVGAIANANRGQPVAWLARDLGTNRQNVQRIVNDLHRDGVVAFEANPHHRRAQLVLLTEKGRQAYEAAMALQAPWIDGLSEGLAIDDLKAVRRVITSLREKLEGDPSREKQYNSVSNGACE
jgi:DNA-binding MarR family transcriptional regulator